MGHETPSPSPGLGQSGGGSAARRGCQLPSQPARGRRVPMTTRTPHPAPPHAPGRAAPPAKPRWEPRAVPPTVPEWRASGRLQGGARVAGVPDAGVVPPARPRWVAGPGRAARPRQDWLLPRDITRLGEKCERERESQPQRRELRAEQGPPLCTPSPPPARGATPQSRRLSGARGTGRRCLVSDSAAARGRGTQWAEKDAWLADPRRLPEAGPTRTGPQASSGASPVLGAAEGLGGEGPAGRKARSVARRLLQVRLREGMDKQ